jgi:NAD(P)-dependent dehydrogenase (short-subunit alcohol dehydrogenase family)
MMGPYAASKAALEMLSQIGRMELAPFDIDVSYIEPGSHKTPIWERSGQAADEFEARLPQIARDHYGDALRGVRAIAARQARTGGDPADVAAAIATALTATHPAARYTVGNDTRLRRVLGLLPPRVREQLLIRVLERAGHA